MPITEPLVKPNIDQTDDILNKNLEIQRLIVNISDVPIIYVCKYCDIDYGYKYNLAKHLKKCIVKKLMLDKIRILLQQEEQEFPDKKTLKMLEEKLKKT